MIGARRALGREQSHPDVRLVARHARLDHRRHVGKLRRARRAGDRERAQLAGLDVADHAGGAGNRHHHLAAEEIGRRLAAALVRDVIHLDAGHRREQRGEQMLTAAVARRRVVDLAGPLLHVGDEFLERLHRQRRIDDQHAGLAADERDRREVLDRIVGELRVERRADRVGLRREQQRVAVRRGAWRRSRCRSSRPRRACSRRRPAARGACRAPARSRASGRRRRRPARTARSLSPRAKGSPARAACPQGVRRARVPPPRACGGTTSRWRIAPAIPCAARAVCVTGAHGRDPITAAAR